MDTIFNNTYISKLKFKQAKYKAIMPYDTIVFRDAILLSMVDTKTLKNDGVFMYVLN